MINGKFLGGAEEVGSLALHMKVNNTPILIDYGLTPSKPPAYPPMAPPMDAVFITHAHLDHSGMLPKISSNYDANIYMTEATMAVLPLLLNDTIKVANIEGFPIPYIKEEIENLMESIVPVTYGEKIELGELEVIPHNAGHIPGSAMYEIKSDKTMLFTGDIQTVNTHLMWGAKPVKTDILFMESTYAGREHPPREKVEEDFKSKIEEVVDRGGTAIVPAFAVGRTQEIMLILEKMDLDIWLDGMGKFVNSIYLKFPKYLRSAKKLKRARNKMNVVRRRKDRKQAMDGDVIITTGGMLEGGPVLHYINYLKNDEKSSILLTGYQVEGTNGRLLMEDGILDLYGIKEKIDMEIDFFDFSAHAGHSELLEFAEKCEPSTIVLMHGDKREALADDLRKRDFEIKTPAKEEIFKL